ncbi:unnamed protein product [Kuraishia capsulata CBS 1993]|uniref:Major facilitator superfamily (MFS) profile domain-containing protein n=1 Tax=Kuraishia capsulata CBS 1993 TaxID=1382522 RepID=W6MT63_9ASCO|nr:uncharacterized protein KUCA_T00000917001 [Kuraishia capsulata CBS 1993]CDK24950.1 unnamed protein product [Kuraishia capsulata CBS 1993]
MNAGSSNIELDTLDVSSERIETVVQPLPVALKGKDGLEGISEIQVSYRGPAPEIPEERRESDNLDEEDEEFPDGGLKAWLVVGGSFFGLVADFGLINSMGAIQAYVSAHQLSNVSSSTSAWIFSIFTFFSYVGGIFSGILFDEIGAKVPLIAGSTLFFVGLFCTANCTSVYQFVLAFGVVAGLGAALCMAPLVGVISHWFKRKRATAVGMATLGGSIGGIIFPILLNSLYTSLGFVWAIRILSFVILACLSLSILLVKERLSERRHMSPTSTSLREISFKQVLATISTYLRNAVDFKALQDRRYALCVVGVAFGELSLICGLTYFASYAIRIGASTSVANMMIVIVNAVGIAGRYVPGLLADRYGVFNVMSLMLIGVFLSDIVLWYGIGRTVNSLYAYTVFYGFFSGSVLSISPVCCSAISPTRDFGKRYATMYLLAGFIFLVGVPVAGAIIGDESIHRYEYFILYTSILALIGASAFVCARLAISRTLWKKV